METSILAFLFFTFGFIHAQDTIQVHTVDSVKTNSQIFSLSPTSKKADKINGL